MINIQLPDQNQTAKLQYYIDTLTPFDKKTLEGLSDDTKITAWVEGLNLACPMPLLKTKVALREVQQGDSIYVLATDPNSQSDLTAFCKQNNLAIVFAAHSDQVTLFEANNVQTCDSLEKLDTIFHLIITKTYGN